MQKLNYLNYYDRLQHEQNSPSLVIEYSRAIEADEGRQNIRISEGPVPTIVLNAHKMLHPISQASSASPVFFGNASVFRLCIFVHHRHGDLADTEKKAQLFFQFSMKMYDYSPDCMNATHSISFFGFLKRPK